MQTHANMQLGPDTDDELIERAPQSEAACLVVDVQLGNKQVSSLAATSVTRSP